MKSKLIVLLTIFSLGVFVFQYFAYEKNSATQLDQEVYLKGFDPMIQKFAQKDHFNKEEYQKRIQKIRDHQYHLESGRKLYQVAFAKAMYSEHKLRILQMAKEHLLMAKRMGDQK